MFDINVTKSERNNRREFRLIVEINEFFAKKITGKKMLYANVCKNILVKHFLLGLIFYRKHSHEPLKVISLLCYVERKLAVTAIQ